MKHIEFMRRGGRVKRFHGFHLLMENPVGHHTFNVMGILIGCIPHELLTKELLMAAHHHDIAECLTGDMPAPIKRKIPGLRDAMDAEEVRIMADHGCSDYVEMLSPQERTWLKLADSLDGAFHCLEERKLGNRMMVNIFHTFMNYVVDLLNSMDRTYTEVNTNFDALMQYLWKEWQEHE